MLRGGIQLNETVLIIPLVYSLICYSILYTNILNLAKILSFISYIISVRYSYI